MLIYDLDGLHPEAQKLCCCGVYLNASMSELSASLQDCGVPPGATITVQVLCFGFGGVVSENNGGGSSSSSTTGGGGGGDDKIEGDNGSSSSSKKCKHRGVDKSQRQRRSMTTEECDIRAKAKVKAKAVAAETAKRYLFAKSDKKRSFVEVSSADATPGGDDEEGEDGTLGYGDDGDLDAGAARASAAGADDDDGDDYGASGAGAFASGASGAGDHDHDHDDDDDADDYYADDYGGPGASASGASGAAPATSEVLSSVEEAATTSSPEIIIAHNARDDAQAPSTLLLAARELRESINRNTHGGSGLMMNKFHIRQRPEAQQKKKKKNKMAAFKVDKYAEWVVTCDVCNSNITLNASFNSLPPLYNFSNQHLRQQGHCSKGEEISATMKLMSQTAARDVASETAASNSRLAIASRTRPASRDSAAFEGIPMTLSSVDVLVGNIAALEFTEEARGDLNFVTHVRCTLCNYKSRAAVDQPAIVSELEGHLSSAQHSHRRRHCGGLPALWGALRAGPAPPPPPPPDLTLLCWGYHERSVEIKGQSLETSALLHYDASNLDWFPEPNTRIQLQPTGNEELLVISGTFRSNDPPCQRYCVVSSGQRLPSLTCLSCKGIGQRRSFRRALLRRHDTGRDQRFTNYSFLTRSALEKIAQDKAAEVVALQKLAWVSRQNFMRKSQHLRSIREDLEESAHRGDTRRLIRNISTFAKEGKDEKRSALLPFICDLMESAVRRDAVTGHGSKGMRWAKTSKQMLKVIKLKGGDSLLRFFRETAGSAADSTIEAQWRKDRVWLDMGEHRTNFVVVGEIYLALMKMYGIQGPVPWELQEDETHINGRLALNALRDIIVGTCGKKCEGHKCDANHAQEPIGSSVEGFRRVEDCALLDQRASYLRAVVVTPLHPDLPALTVVVHPTCLRFDCPWVINSWDLLDRFGEEALASSLGPVAQGHGADGAAPLFKAMTSRVAIPPGAGRFHLAAPGLVITGKIVIIDGQEYVKDLHSQDMRHNLSKMYAAADNRGKDLHMGTEVASHFDFCATAALADKNDDSHGVIKRHLDRSDVQSKTGPSVLVARLMLGCMSKAVSGGYGRKEPFEGSLAFGRMLSRFLLISFGKKQSGLDRARHAGYFLGLIRRARWHVKETKGLTLAANFLTAQSYSHSVQAAQVAILKIKAQRVFHNHLPLHIEDMGSNAVEKLWSSTGGYGVVRSNQRDYDAEEGLRRIEHLLTLQKFAAQQKGMNFGRENRSTQRDIKIHLHEYQGAPDADPMVHFQDEALIKAWIEGDKEAKVEAEKLGMKPSGASEWWLSPWKDEEAHIAEMKQDDDLERTSPAVDADGGDGPGCLGQSKVDGGGEDEEEGSDDDSDDDVTSGVGECDGNELVQSLTSLIMAGGERRKVDPMVDVPEERGGGRVYKRTLCDAYNGSDTKLDASRLRRFKQSSQSIADIDAAQARLAEKKRANEGATGTTHAAAGSAGSAGSAAASAAAASAAASVQNSGTASGTAGAGFDAAGPVHSRTATTEVEETKASSAVTSVTIGSDVAFAMVEGTLPKPVYKAWIGRISKLFRDKSIWRHGVSLDGDLPSDMHAMCDWYSPIEGTGDLKYHFGEVTDLGRYSFQHLIGVVRIDVVRDCDTSTSTSSNTTTITSRSSGSGSSSSSSSSGTGCCTKEKYSISRSQLVSLKEALKMTTPVPGSNRTLGDKRKRDLKQQQARADDANRTKKPRAGPSSYPPGREGTRAATVANERGGGNDGVAKNGGGSSNQMASQETCAETALKTNNDDGWCGGDGDAAVAAGAAAGTGAGADTDAASDAGAGAVGAAAGATGADGSPRAGEVEGAVLLRARSGAARAPGAAAFAAAFAAGAATAAALPRAMGRIAGAGGAGVPGTMPSDQLSTSKDPQKTTTSVITGGEAAGKRKLNEVAAAGRSQKQKPGGSGGDDFCSNPSDPAKAAAEAHLTRQSALGLAQDFRLREAEEPGSSDLSSEIKAANRLERELAGATVLVKDLEGDNKLDREGRVGALKAIELLLTNTEKALMAVLKPGDVEVAECDDDNVHALVLKDLQNRITVVCEAWEAEEEALWSAMIPVLLSDQVAAGDGTPGHLRQPLTAAEQVVVAAVWNHGDKDANAVCSLAAGVGGSKVTLLGKHFGRMREGWLFDESVNAYMFLLQERDKKLCAESAGAKTPSHFMGSFFFEKVRDRQKCS